ncbi:MarR family winged helix-turn-helix transcriptional regulator [Streptomyces sp. NPDC002454]|uniref:MarR family winged helix-turn-helix transcriptional regulator n=1 Tax=Streptomyces sp. NPDC002490 TaxID=3154416 RepID=UPI00331AB8C0
MTTAPARSEHSAQRTMRAFLSAARLLSEQLGQELRRESDVSQIHYEVLAWLADAPGHQLPMSELARRTGVSTSRLSHLVDRLEQQERVERHTDPGDRRVHLARLTPSGERALEDAAPWHAACARTRLLDHLTDDELRQLHDISERLRQRLTTPRGPDREAM